MAQFDLDLTKHIETEIKKFDLGRRLYCVTDAAIAKLNEEYMQLEITDVNDEEQFAMVKTARLNVRDLRIKVDNTRIELKADALAYGKTIQNEANRITELLAPIEQHLKAEEQKVKDEAARKEENARLKLIEITSNRIEAMNKFGMYFEPVKQLYVLLDAVNTIVIEIDMTMLQSYDTNQFEAFLFNVETEATKIAADKAAIEEADKEAQRIVEKEQRAAEELRIENEEKQKVLDDEKEKLAADKAAFEKEKTDAATKKANEEKLQLEIAKAKEDARIAAEKKVADEKAAAEKKVADDKKKADAIEARRILAAERKERLKSDKTKLDDLAFKFEELQYPTVKQKEAIDIIAAFQKDIATLVANLILDAAGLE